MPGIEEFSTKGYEAATVAGIAERAGVTTGALYAHFAGKLDLLLATVGLTPAAEVVDAIVGMVARPWSEASRIMSHGLATPPDRGTRLLLDVIVVARRDPHVARILRRGLETYLEAMKVANDKGVALGAIDPALRTDELARFRVWFEAFDAARFDQKIERDVPAGKLDLLAEQAIADFKRGRACKL